MYSPFFYNKWRNNRGVILKLTELNPEWLGRGGEGVYDKDHNPISYTHGAGISFDCPCGCEKKIAIMFNNPLDGKRFSNRNAYWDRSGDTFETLTLSPSILNWNIEDHSEHWHGFITNGEIITV